MMDLKDLKALTTEQIKTFDKTRFEEVEKDIRNHLINLRFDLLNEKSKNSALKKNLRKILARVLTVKRSLKLNDNNKKI